MKTFIVTISVVALALAGSVSAYAGENATHLKPKLGDKCAMVKPYVGEQGWVWSDGNCHHLDLTFDPGYSGTTPTTPSAPIPGGGTCIMKGGPHNGESGYVWSDGQCHHQKPGFKGFKI